MATRQSSVPLSKINIYIYRRYTYILCIVYIYIWIQCSDSPARDWKELPVCWRMLTYATYADVCWRMLTFAKICWHMHIYSGASRLRATGKSSTLLGCMLASISDPLYCPRAPSMSDARFLCIFLLILYFCSIFFFAEIHCFHFLWERECFEAELLFFKTPNPFFCLSQPLPPTDGGGFRDCYHKCTNSILQQLKRFFLENCRCIVPNFMND
jgi:hypothetical protein